MTNVAHSASLESQLKLAHEESDLFFLQLQLVRKELEHFSLGAAQAAPSAQVRSAATAPAMQAWIDDDLPNALAENQRLDALLGILKENGQLELSKSLSARVGGILVEGVDEPRRLFSAPVRLARIWRESLRQKAPAELGGDDFSKVIEAHESGGFEAVDKLLESSSGALYANACTALARHLMTSDRDGTVEAARRAYVQDPKPFRLKWLAFRLHESGDLTEAEAMLDALPAGTPFSESEQRQAGQLRYEARQLRLRSARKKTGYAERRAEVERRFSELEAERDALAQTLEERSREASESGAAVEALRHEVAALHEARARHEGLSAKLSLSLKVLQQEYAVLEEGRALAAREHAEHVRRLQQRDQEVVALKAAAERFEQEMAAWISDEQAHALRLEEKLQEQTRLAASIEQLEQERLALEARCDAQFSRMSEQTRVIEELQAAKVVLEREQAVLSASHTEQSRLLRASTKQMDALKAAKTRLDMDKALLKSGQAEQFRLLGERDREIKVLRATVERLETERAALAVRDEERLQAQEGWRLEAEQLKVANARVEQEKAVLEVRYEERLRGVDDSAREIEALRAAVSALEEERNSLTSERDEAVRLSAARLERVQQLQQKLQGHQETEAETSAHEQRMQDEMKRVAAQLDLMKDMLL